MKSSIPCEERMADQTSRRVAGLFEIPVNIKSVVSVAMHGRKAYFITTKDGKRREFGDVNDFYQELKKEIGNDRQARKIINNLRGIFWMDALKEKVREHGYQASRELLSVAREILKG